MALIEETNPESDLAQRQVGRSQQLLGQVNPSLQNVLVWGEAGGLSKRAAEMIRTETGDPCHACQGQLRGEMRLNVFGGAPKRGPRHAADLAARREGGGTDLAEKMDAKGKANGLLIEKT